MTRDDKIEHALLMWIYLEKLIYLYLWYQFKENNSRWRISNRKCKGKKQLQVGTNMVLRCLDTCSVPYKPFLWMWSCRNYFVTSTHVISLIPLIYEPFPTRSVFLRHYWVIGPLLSHLTVISSFKNCKIVLYCTLPSCYNMHPITFC